MNGSPHIDPGDPPREWQPGSVADQEAARPDRAESIARWNQAAFGPAPETVTAVRAEHESFWINLGIRPEDLPPHTQLILHSVVQPALHKWALKSIEYGETADHLGSKGQYADMHRKMGKLKRLMWDDDRPPTWALSEDVQEVLADLIGHCVLSIYYINKEQEKGRA